MKHAVVLSTALALALLSIAHADEAPSLQTALDAYGEGEYTRCADILTALPPPSAPPFEGSELFQVECLSAAGRTAAALAYLQAQLPLGRISVDDLKHKDRPGLNALRTVPGWPAVLARAEALDSQRQAHIDQPLRQQLLQRMQNDQAARNQAIEQGGGAEAWKQLEPIDRDNTAWLQRVVAEKGWPGIALVGRDGYRAAFLIAQHADLAPAFQQQVLALMQPALARQDVLAEDVAMLTDRVLRGQGKPQRYGTQFGVDEQDRLFLQPTEDEAGLDARRREMNLPPIDDYKQQLSQLYGKPLR